MKRPIIKRNHSVDLFMSWFNATAFVFCFIMIFFIIPDVDIEVKIFFFVFSISAGSWTIYWTNKLNEDKC